MGVKMNLRITADPEIGFVTKFILKRYSRTAAMPTALELNKTCFICSLTIEPFQALHSCRIRSKNRKI